MLESQIVNMLSDLLHEIDYDIWKSLFLEESELTTEEKLETLDELIRIVKKYL